MFAAGPSGTKLSSLVTRAIRPGYGGPGWKRFVQVKATPTAQMTGCRISSRVGPLASGCRRASGGRGTTRPFGLMLLTFPNGRG
jgi:hypothetical protein